MAGDPSTDTAGADLPLDLEERFYALWLDRPATERETGLARLCEENEAHAADLQALARRLARSDSVLAQVREHAPLDAHPERIGPYIVREPIAAGGFGVVYRAEQQTPVRRTVAIKLLQAGRLSAHGLARFANERQALALMDHPAIAHVFDAGTTEDGRPYFVMEFVDGQPITAFCDAERATIETRLTLFSQVCAAVDHAHQKGVVHRDLKPQNVLVSSDGGTVLPRVIDFGIAKAIQEDVGTSTLDTIEGALVGTPEYMSPEQAASRPVDVRTDVWALGVMLYELLTGDLPFDRARLRAGSLVELARIVCEEEPRRPSTVVGSPSSPAAAEVARRRGTSTRLLQVHLRGDLEWIVRKCLEKDPARRYGSVGALVADIERYLRHQPVEARQPVFSYLARKFVRRHRVGVGVAAFVLLVCTAGVIGLVWALFAVDTARIQEARHRGEAELQSYAAHVAAAKLAFDTGAIGNARRHLLDATPALRGWEWRHVQALCDGSETRLTVGPMPDGLAWLSDHELLVADKSGFDGQEGVPVAVWDVASGEPVRRFDCRGVAELWCAPDGGRFVTSSVGGIELWNARTGDRTARLHPVVDEFVRVVLAGDPAGTRLAFASEDGIVRLAQLGGDLGVVELGRVGTRVCALAFTEDADTLLVGLVSGAIVAYRVEDFAESYRLEHHDQPISRLLLGGDGSTLYSAGGSTIHVVDLATRTVRQTLHAPQGVNRLALSPDGRRLYVVGGWADGFVLAFDMASSTVADRFVGHERGVRGLALSPDGARFATSGRDHTVRVWPRRSTAVAGQVAAGFDARSLVRSADGRHLATAAMDGSWTVWTTDTMEVVASGRADEPLFACAMGDRRVYAIGERIHGFDIETGLEVKDSDIRPEWTSVQPIARDALVDPAGGWLACSSYDRLYVWPLPLGPSAWVIDAPFMIHCLAADPTTGLLAAGCADGTVRFFDPQTGAVRRSLAGLGPTSTLDVDPGATGQLPIYRIAFWGARIATASADGRVRVLDRGSDRPTMVLRGHEMIATGVAFSPDGSRIVSAGGDGYVRIWDAQSGIELLPLRERSEVAQEVHFSADGSRIFTRYHVWVTPTFLQWWDAPPLAR